MAERHLIDDELYASSLPLICHVCNQSYARSEAAVHRWKFGHWPHEFGATETEVVLEKVRRIIGW